ncbi:MAG: phosphopyruvate hydratase [Ruminococcus sp.]|nr:phosphopyruvate hydratase [Ruminococcus sp.]
MSSIYIEKVKAREILDSRGNPTVEAEVFLSDGSFGSGCAPSGASTGVFEALELRDGDENRFCGKGVLNAVNNVNTIISHTLRGLDPYDIYSIDRAMLTADGTEDKSNLGANAILAVSLAAARAAANSRKMPLFRFIGGINACEMPVPMMNILNGGAHAANNIDIQEFMIMPRGASSFHVGMRRCAEVYHNLAKLLKSKGLSTAVGDEGGFAPDLASAEDAIELILTAVEKSGYRAGTDFVIALDAASSEWKGGSAGNYKLPKMGTEMSSNELISYWEKLCGKYPIVSIEDPLDEEDWDGWREITAKMGKNVQLVGDDLFVTNSKRLERGIKDKCGNAILVKLNQIGTLSETMSAVRMAQRNGFGTIISHRSGETEDPFIADLSVALNAGQIKTGAPCRSERTAKYNRLLKIEELIH